MNKATKLIFCIVIFLVFQSITYSGIHYKDLYISFRTSGGVLEGHFWNASPLYTYFKNQPMYFRFTITNRIDVEHDLGDWVKTLRATPISKWGLRKGACIDNMEDGDVILEPIDVKATWKFIGKIDRLPRNKMRKLLPRLNPNALIPQKLSPKKTLEFLALLETDQPLPCGDYVVGVRINAAGRLLGGGRAFRIREVKNETDIAKLQKQKSTIYSLFGQEREELMALEESLKTAPNSPWCWYYLGMYYYDRGNFQKALEYYQEGQKRFPTPKEKLEGNQSRMGPFIYPGANAVWTEIYFENLVLIVKDEMSGE